MLTSMCIRVRLCHREDPRTLVRIQGASLLTFAVSAYFGLGWDSCFEYEGQTYAEMPSEAKNKISHRGKALEKLKEWLKQEVPNA